jgi:hypothetical protein
LHQSPFAPRSDDRLAVETIDVARYAEDQAPS